MAHAWNACWVNALGGSNPPSSAGERPLTSEFTRRAGVFPHVRPVRPRRRGAEGVPSPPRMERSSLGEKPRYPAHHHCRRGDGGDQMSNAGWGGPGDGAGPPGQGQGGPWQGGPQGGQGQGGPQGGAPQGPWQSPQWQQPPSQPPQGPGYGQAPGMQPPAPQRKRPWALLAVAASCILAMILVVGGGITFLALNRGGPEPVAS